MADTLTADDIPDLIESPEFNALPLEQRHTLAHDALAEAAQTQTFDSPEAWKEWGTFAGAVRERAGQDDRGGLKKAAGWTYDNVIKGGAEMGVGMAQQIALLGTAAVDEAQGMVGLPQSGLGNEAAGAFERGVDLRVEQANELLHTKLPGGDKMKSAMEPLRGDIDEGRLPFGDSAAQHQWLDDHANAVQRSLDDWYATLGSHENGGQRASSAYGLNYGPHAELLNRYMLTRDPAVWTQLEDSMAKSPERHELERRMRRVEQGPVGQALDAVYLGGHNLHAATDPVNIALLASGVGRGAAALEGASTWRNVALRGLKAAPEMTAIGAGMTALERPGATLGEITEGGLKMAASGSGLVTGMGGAGKLWRDVRGARAAAVPEAAGKPAPDRPSAAEPGREGASAADFDAMDAHFGRAMGEEPVVTPPPAAVRQPSDGVRTGESAPAVSFSFSTDNEPTAFSYKPDGPQGSSVDAKKELKAQGFPEAGVQAFLDRFYKPDAYRHLAGDDVVWVPAPSTTGDNTIPLELAKRLARDHGGTVVPLLESFSSAESKNKRGYLPKMREPVALRLKPGAEALVPELAGKRVVLVDDLMTSGETTETMGRELGKHGVPADDVAVLTAANEGRAVTPKELNKLANILSAQTSVPYKTVRANVELVHGKSRARFITRAIEEAKQSNANAREIQDLVARRARALQASAGTGGGDVSSGRPVRTAGTGGPGEVQGLPPLAGDSRGAERAPDVAGLPDEGSGFSHTKLKFKTDSGAVDVAAIAQGVQHGAELFARGVRKLSRWSAAMIRHFGESVREHLPHIWRSVNAWAKDEIAQGRKRMNVGINPAQLLAYTVRGADWLMGTAKEQAREMRERMSLPRWTDVAKTVNGWVGRMQGSSVAIRNIMHEIERRVPDAVRREGITNWIQAGGDDAVLAAREASSKGKLKEGYKAARNLTADEIALAQKVRGYYDAALAKAQAHGLVEDGLENYVNQVWKKPVMKGKADALADFQGQLSRTFKFGKQRKLESFHEGEQLGFEPVTKDVSKLLGLYLNELNKTIATREMIGNLTQGKASDGRPLAVPVGGVLGSDGTPSESTLVLPNAKGTVRFDGAEHDTRDYKRINNPALAKWKFVAPDTQGKPVMVLGELAVHPEAFKVISNALGQSEIRRWMNERADSAAGHLARLGVRAVDALQSQVKASMMSLSPFHVVQEGTHAVGHKVNPFTNIPAVDANNPAHVDMMNHGLMLAGDRVSMSQFMDGFAPAGSWLEKIPGIGKWQKAMSEWTFEHYIPGLKIKTYEGILRRNTARFEADIKAGKVSLDDVKYLSAKQTNAAYGHLNYKDMGRNPTFQHLLRLCLLAPDFLEARSKFTGQAMQGIASKVGREQAFAMATLAVTFYVAARAMNAALNDGDTKNDLDHLFTVQAGNRVFSMRSVPEDIYRLVHDWQSFTAGRVSPLIGTGVLEGIFGVNRRGEKLDGGDVVQDMLANALPMSVRMVPGLRDLTRTQKNSPVNPWEQFLGALGLQIGRHSPITEMQKQVHKFTDAMGIEDRGTYPVSRYQQLRYALEDQDWDKAKLELQALAPPGTNKKQLMSAFHSSLFRHWTKNAAMDKKWKATLDEDQKALLGRAEQRRKDVWERFQRLMR